MKMQRASGNTRSTNPPRNELAQVYSTTDAAPGDRLGITLQRHGVPARPGSLFWLARLRGVPILRMPNCGPFSRATGFDLVLPRVLAGESVGRAELAELGHGGFLSRDMAFCFPPYRPSRDRGEIPPDDG
jgi:hypothetical protein